MANGNIKGDAVAVTETPENLRRKVERIRRFAVGNVRQTKDLTDDYTLVLEDYGSLLLFTSATTKTITVPNSLPEGWWCDLLQLGAQTATFTAATGATVNSLTGTEETGGQYGRVRLEVVANSDGESASAVLSGDLEPAP